MRQLRLVAPAQFGNDPAGQNLPQFDTPLVKAVDRPDRALGENTVFVKRHQAAERRGIRAVSISLLAAHHNGYG